MSERAADVAPVRAGEELDWDRLEAYLRAQLPELAGPFEVLQFPNGSANLTYLVRIGDHDLVVRRPPFGQLAPGAHDMRREFRAIDALSRHFDRAPRPYLFCDDHDVIGSDFLVVEYRRGVVVWDVVPESMAHHADAARRIGMAVVDALAELHLLDPDAIGLGDLGRPAGFVERQVRGWRQRWDLVDAGRVPAMPEVGERLAATIPPVRPGGRRCCTTTSRSTTASSIRPTLTVCGRSSTGTWPRSAIRSSTSARCSTTGPTRATSTATARCTCAGMELMGLPGRAEVVARYAERTGFDVSSVAWFEAFATWKTAVVLEQLYQRYVRGESTDPRMAERGEPVARLARRAGSMLDRLLPTP